MATQFLAGARRSKCTRGERRENSGRCSRGQLSWCPQRKRRHCMWVYRDRQENAHAEDKVVEQRSRVRGSGKPATPITDNRPQKNQTPPEKAIPLCTRSRSVKKMVGHAGRDVSRASPSSKIKQQAPVRTAVIASNEDHQRRNAAQNGILNTGTRSVSLHFNAAHMQRAHAAHYCPLPGGFCTRGS